MNYYAKSAIKALTAARDSTSAMLSLAASMVLIYYNQSPNVSHNFFTSTA